MARNHTPRREISAGDGKTRREELSEVASAKTPCAVTVRSFMECSLRARPRLNEAGRVTRRQERHTRGLKRYVEQPAVSTKKDGCSCSVAKLPSGCNPPHTFFRQALSGHSMKRSSSPFKWRHYAPAVILLQRKTDDVLDHDPAARQLPVAALLFAAQFAFARLLLRRPALFMQLRQPLIAAVGEQFKALMHFEAAPLVKRKIVCRAAPVVGADDLPARAVDDDLRLQRVPLLLPAVVRLLLFFGRSTGVSATSTTMNSISWSAG